MRSTEQIPTPNGTIPLYVSTPDSTGPWPAVVVIHDAFGLTDNARHHADWLASAGFLAGAPDLYTRGNKFACIREAFRAITARKGRPFDDIEASRTALASRSDCSGRIGVIGFCQGGGFALLAAVDRGFNVSSVNYGLMPSEVDFLSGACPIVGSFGGKDPGLKGAAKTLDTALASYGIDKDIVEYPSASHCFMDQFSSIGGWLLARIGFGYHPDEAADARKRIVHFFNNHLRLSGQGAVPFE